jgi:hypothetical protein
MDVTDGLGRIMKVVCAMELSQYLYEVSNSQKIQRIIFSLSQDSNP